MTQPVTDPFSDAQSGFVKLDDLLGRLVLIEPLSSEMRQSTMPGQTKDYESITAAVVVLDGSVTEKIESIPFKVESMFISGGVIVPQIKGKLPQNGVKPAQPYVLGRLGQQPSKQYGDKGSLAWVLNGGTIGRGGPAVPDKLTESDKQLARNYLATVDPFA